MGRPAYKRGINGRPKLGLSLDESAELIAMYEPGSNNKKQLSALVGKIQQRKQQLVLQKQEIERLISDLNAWEARSLAEMDSSSA